MKKILLLLFINLFIFGGINFTYGYEKTIQELKQEMSILEKEFKNTKNVDKIQEINKKYDSLMTELLTREGKLIVNDRLERGPNLDVISYMEPGDILIFKNTYGDWSDNFIGGWNHAVVAYDYEHFVDIGSFRVPSAIVHVDEIYDRIFSGYYSKIGLLKMGLTRMQQVDLRNYIDKNLLGKPYDYYFSVWTDSLYCSELVRKAHLNSGRKVNLDSDWGYFVEPADFLKSKYVKQIMYDSF